MKKKERKPPHLEGLMGHPGKWLGGITPSAGVRLAIRGLCRAQWNSYLGARGGKVWPVGVKKARPGGGGFPISLGPSWGRW